MLRFIEDNWGLGRIGDHSFDARAASIAGLLDLRHRGRRAPRVLLDPRSGMVRRVVDDQRARPQPRHRRPRGGRG